ncbi:Tryptophan synthase alpha chain [Labilithrix luteola]|uniref:Tryptophan synthase alpha chain n=1 Tax=Labilithrix luteola TaxID=1391654 RepID=A0A0K1Q003_9BACT|nr:hypothetical protein [Labilithrix luteola]AKU99115.1 Tryptophan synthase alpha chain [Labilithrix luteola]
MRTSLSGIALVTILAPLVVSSACARQDDVPIGGDCPQGLCERRGPLAPSQDGSVDEADATAPKVLACIGTECPAPYATCWKTSSFRCETNLMNDSANCGACGHSCEGFEGLNMVSRCVNGACVLECVNGPNPRSDDVFLDCNGLIDDGCESDIIADRENCGVCGHACPAGVACVKGKCGCGADRIYCGNHCTDTRIDDRNCGACGKVCDWRPPSACNPPVPNTYYGCAASACDALKCQEGFADCNDDRDRGCASDGCETNIRSDRHNCGGCGIECGPQQECRYDETGPHCADSCSSSGGTECEDGCRDLVGDPNNCGACGNMCPQPAPHQASSCAKGFCRLDCLPGFADCNGDPSDGCEINLAVHPANCGACGTVCDIAVGQPCIEGKCLMVACGPGETN